MDFRIWVAAGNEFFAIGAHCIHYGGPLAEGLVVGETVRCPWHHACFSLQNGEALRAPALDPVPCWRVERLGDLIFVREKVSPPAPKRGTDDRSSVVIVGGGAASLAAAANLAVSLAHQSMRIDEKTNQNLIAAFVRELGTREGRFSDGLGNKVANLPRFSEGDR